MWLVCAPPMWSSRRGVRSFVSLRGCSQDCLGASGMPAGGSACPGFRSQECQPSPLTASAPVQRPRRGRPGVDARASLGSEGPRRHLGVCPAHTASHLHLCLGCLSAADPFDPLLLPSDPDTQPYSKPDLFGQLLTSDSTATASVSFPSIHSAPPPAHNPDFAHLGKHCLGSGAQARWPSTGPGRQGQGG